MYGDSKRAQRFYQQDSDAEEEEELLPNPKLAQGSFSNLNNHSSENQVPISHFTR